MDERLEADTKAKKKPTRPKKNAGVKISITAKLLRILMPMVAVAIIFIIVFLSSQARSIISSMAMTALDSDSNKNAATIGAEITNMLWGYNQDIESVENLGMTDNAEIQKYLEITLNWNDMSPNGVYGGFEDGSYLDPTGWVPDADYVTTERDWYIQAKDSEDFVIGEPYVDSDSGSLVVTASRAVTLANGKKGVLGVTFS